MASKSSDWKSLKGGSIYAHRYGSVASSAGKSITDVELDEANHALSTGTVSDILLYLIEEDSTWGSNTKNPLLWLSQGSNGSKKKLKNTLALNSNQPMIFFFPLSEMCTGRYQIGFLPLCSSQVTQRAAGN